VRALLMLIGFVSLAAMPYTVLMPIFAGSILHGGARELGMLMGATGVGALLGALTLASKSGVEGLGKWVWRAAVVFGASLIFFAWSRHLWLSMAFLISIGNHDLHEHALAGHGSRSITRAGDVALLHDVHRNGPYWRPVRRRLGG